MNCIESDVIDTELLEVAGAGRFGEAMNRGAQGAAVGGAVGAAFGSKGMAAGAGLGAAFGMGYGAREGGGGRGNGKSRVICTHLMSKGLLDVELWRADLTFTRQYLPAAMVRGYQFWAIPYVRLMRRSPMAEKFMRPLAQWRAEEVAYRMGGRAKGNWKGKLLRWVGEPVCLLIGQFVPEQDWEALWHENSSAV